MSDKQGRGVCLSLGGVLGCLLGVIVGGVGGAFVIVGSIAEHKLDGRNTLSDLWVFMLGGAVLGGVFGALCGCAMGAELATRLRRAVRLSRLCGVLGCLLGVIVGGVGVAIEVGVATEYAEQVKRNGGDTPPAFVYAWLWFPGVLGGAAIGGISGAMYGSVLGAEKIKGDAARCEGAKGQEQRES